MNRNTLLSLMIASAAALASARSASAQVDGTAEAAYGPALAVQSVQTNFGNSNLGQPLNANGSELDAAYGRIANGNLYIVLAGNLESNFNKLDIFIDSGAGGQNRLLGNNADVDFNGLNRMGDNGTGNGLTFDAGFEADHYFTVTGGNTPYQLFANYAQLLTAGGGAGGFLGGSANDTGLINGNFNGTPITIAINNSNVAGVDGGTGAASGAGVVTGVELEIPLSLLGNPTGDIRVSAFINGGGHDFLSNQVLGGLDAGTGNLGEPRAVNFGGLGGNQFFTVAAIPEPTSLAVIGLPAMALLARRRKAK